MKRIRNFFGLLAIAIYICSFVILFSGGADSFFALSFVMSLFFTVVFLRIDRAINGTIPQASNFARRYF